MFIDASAVIAILAREDDAGDLLERLAAAGSIEASPVVIFESALGLARSTGAPVQDAMALVERFLDQCGATIVSIDQATSRIAVAAFERYGKGRHKAALNMGDCFAYACTQLLDTTLLCKGNDFPHTDITRA